MTDPSTIITSAVAAYEASAEAHDAAVRKGNSKYDTVERGASEAYGRYTLEADAFNALARAFRARDAAEAERIHTHNRDAFKAALSTDATPLAAWIIKKALDTYNRPAMTILKALPATLKTLNELADDEGWCDDWKDLVRQAQNDGVVPEDHTVTLF